MPPMNCERAVFGLMTRPTANTPSTRGRRTSPLSASTRDLDELGAERVARELGLRLDLVAGVDRHLALALREQRLAGAHDRGAPRRGAHRAAGDRGDAEVGVADLAGRTCSGSTPSASAAIWVSTVRAPVPMSVAAIWTV